MFALLFTLLSAPVHAGGDLREREAAILEQVAQDDPALHAELLELRETDRELYRAQLREIAVEERRHNAHAEMANDPEMLRLKAQRIELEDDMRALLVEYKAAGSREQDRMRPDIEALAGELFDTKSAMHARKMELMAQRLEDAQAKEAERLANKDELVSEWVDTKLESLDQD
jgi:hypothetical protein